MALGVDAPFPQPHMMWMSGWQLCVRIKCFKLIRNGLFTSSLSKRDTRGTSELSEDFNHVHPLQSI